ncbi:MAG: Na+/H+ antiporter NhaC family protein, partial [Pirellulaceae bacterium]
LITLGIFLAIGYSGEPAAAAVDTASLKSAIAERFNINFWLFLVPLGVLVLVGLRVSAVAALFVGVILGAIFAVIFQPDIVKQVSGLPIEAVEQDDGTVVEPPGYIQHAYSASVNAMADSTSAVPDVELESWQAERQSIVLERAREATSNPALTMEEYEEAKDDIEMDHTVSELDGKIAAAGLMNGKGMFGMLNTIWLIISAMCFGGVMQASGFLRRITEPLVKMASSDGSLVATTAGSCMFVNATASDQYLAIVVPGQMFHDTYEERGLAPQNLSRTLEDSGTVTSVLVPWNTCGATQQGVLGVNVLAFAPFCFFNIISPFMTMFYGFMGIKIARLKDSKTRSAEESRGES